MNTEYDLLQKKHERLIKAVSQMRHAQKQYIQYYARSDKIIMQRHQRVVDALIEEELKEMKALQKSLEFNT